MKKSTFKIQGKIDYIASKVIYVNSIPINYSPFRYQFNYKVGDYVCCEGQFECMVYRKRNGEIEYTNPLILDSISILKTIKEKNIYDIYIPKMLVDKGKYYIIADYKGIDTLFPLDTEVINLSQGYYESLQIRETTVIEKVDNVVFSECKKLKMLNAILKEISESEIRSLYDATENLENKI